MRFPPSRFFVWPGVAVLVAVLAIQLVPYGHNRVNPPVVAEPAWNAAVTRALARDACFDCHSNQTQWPLYSRVAPASWLVQWDVEKGRAKLNFSEWQRRQDDAHEAAEAVQKGEMPPAKYRLMHAHARLSDADRLRLAEGLTATIGGESDAGHQR